MNRYFFMSDHELMQHISDVLLYETLWSLVSLICHMKETIVSVYGSQL